MKVAGDVDVCRTITSKRSDEALVDEVLSANRKVLRHEAHWMYLDGGVLDRVVELPDATTLPEGWKEVIHNYGSTNELEVKDDDAGGFNGNLLHAVQPGVACEFMLVDNGTANGVWYVYCMEPAEDLAANKFCVEFDSTDFPAAVGDYKTLTSAQKAGLGATTHGRGSSPIYLLQERSVSGAKATLVEQDLTFDADNAGLAGNSITVQYVDTVTAGSEVVNVSGTDIVVSIEDGVSTATQIKAALDASVQAAALIDTTISGVGATAQNIFGPTNLATGTDSEFDKILADRERMNSAGDLAIRVVTGCEFNGRVCLV